MTIKEDVAEVTEFTFADNGALAIMVGQFDANLALIEHKLGVQIVRRGNALNLLGDPADTAKAAHLLETLYDRAVAGKPVGEAEIASLLARHQGSAQSMASQLELFKKDAIEIRTRKKVIEPRTKAQKDYVTSLFEHELAFGIGPAGTGKTYLAVAVGVSMFIGGHVDKIVLSRPAVEAGERLGFLPGDMKDKVDPYMQPLYDALDDFLPAKQLARYIAEKSIEIAPLAFMRGRTLARSFVVLDEAQNATTMQMKMFLTRLGEGSRMVITGDRSQIDLPRGVTSGLADAERLLKHLDDVSFSYFTARDVVRHPLVAKIIEAYDKDAENTQR